MTLNPRVLKRMATTPVTIHDMTSPNSVGDVEVKEEFGLSGYVFDETVAVVNHLGVEEISNRQIYLFKEDIDKVNVSMKVTCKDSIKARIIRRKSFDGPMSQTLIGVLYLP